MFQNFPKLFPTEVFFKALIYHTQSFNTCHAIPSMSGEAAHAFSCVLLYNVAKALTLSTLEAVNKLSL